MRGITVKMMATGMSVFYKALHQQPVGLWFFLLKESFYNSSDEADSQLNKAAKVTADGTRSMFSVNRKMTEYPHVLNCGLQEL